MVIGNKVINAPEDTVTDINLDVTAIAMDMTPKHSSVRSADGSHYQGHIVPVNSTDDIVPAIQALCHDPRVAGATNLTYAYLIGNANRYISNYHDDGNWGSGREILHKLDATGTFNHLVAITRWCGARTLGPSRFKQAQAVAQEAIQLIPRQPNSPVRDSIPNPQE